MLFDFGLSTIYILDMSRQARATKAKINKWDYIKLKTFCTAKETINKTGTQPTEWGEIFANDVTDEGLNAQNIQTGHTAQYQKNQTIQ